MSAAHGEQKAEIEINREKAVKVSWEKLLAGTKFLGALRRSGGTRY
jgi:hypothetical protein